MSRPFFGLTVADKKYTGCNHMVLSMYEGQYLVKITPHIPTLEEKLEFLDEAIVSLFKMKKELKKNG